MCEETFELMPERPVWIRTNRWELLNVFNSRRIQDTEPDGIWYWHQNSHIFVRHKSVESKEGQTLEPPVYP